jgi:hypothetical protein
MMRGEGSAVNSVRHFGSVLLGKPYVVVWDANPNQGGPTAYQGMWQIIAYEQTGADGRRAVTDIRGRPMTVPEADFSKLTFVGRHKPSK